MSLREPRGEEERVRNWILPCLLLFLAACDQKFSPVEHGARVYAANCTACHNPDPRLEGVMGPPVFGSSRALLEAKLIHASYPPGYTPKRDTQLMQPLPYLAPQIPALAVFLNAR